MKIIELISCLEKFRPNAEIKVTDGIGPDMEILSIYDCGNRFEGRQERTKEEIKTGLLEVWIDVQEIDECAD